MLQIRSRRAWHARYGRGTLDSNSPKREAFIHHSASSDNGADSDAKMATILRGIEDFHVNGRGWNGIAYNYLVFQPRGRLKLARVWEGRGDKYIPAAQLGHNTGTLAICVIAEDDDVKLSTKLQLIRLLRLLKKRHPELKGLGGHKDAPGQSTECPGPKLYATLDTIAKRSGLKRIKR